MIEMNVQEAYARMNGQRDSYPQEEIEVLMNNPKEAVDEGFRQMEQAVQTYRDGGEKAIDPHFNSYSVAFYMMGVLKQPGTFQRMGEFLHEAGQDAVDALYSDLCVDTLPWVLYQTYEGDPDLLENWVQDERIEFLARGSMLRVLEMLVKEDRYPKERFHALWLEIARQIENGKEYGTIPIDMHEIVLSNGWTDFVDVLNMTDPWVETRPINWVDNELLLEDPKEFFRRYPVRTNRKNPYVEPMNPEELRDWRCFMSEEEVKRQEEMYCKRMEEFFKHHMQQGLQFEMLTEQEVASLQKPDAVSSAHPAMHNQKEKSKAAKNKAAKNKAAKKARKKNRKK